MVSLLFRQSRGGPVRWWVQWLALLTGTVLARGAEEGAGLPPWKAMDYGPFLSGTVFAPGPRTNFAYKGIALNLGRAAGTTNNEAIVFDTDLLRYSVGWTGDFVALRGVVYDGEHWAYPEIAGTAVFHTPMEPGWAGTQGFKDPRVEPYGPLPRDHGAWRGLYVHGDRVILSYAVRGMGVLERPSLETDGPNTWFTRSLQLEASPQTQVIQVAVEEGGEAAVVDATGTPAPRGSAVVLRDPRHADSVLVVAVRGEGVPVWDLAVAGHVRLVLPPSGEGRRLKLLLSRVAAGQVAQVLAAGERLPAAVDLLPMTTGGPAHWANELATTPRPAPETSNGTFAVEELTVPDENPWKSWMRFGGVELQPGGDSAWLCTWNGDVWRVTGLNSPAGLRWRRVATGLFQPLGVREVEGELYVLGRDQITRLHDLNHDGEADFYENFNNDGLVSEHFHEFATDLKVGPDGDFYYIRCARHALPAVHSQNGVLYRVSRDGRRSEVVARGFRAVNGLGVGPQGQFTTIDNQGHWMPANRFNWVVRDGWYGNQFAANPDQRTSYDLPLLWMHNQVDRSGGTQLWVPPGMWGFLGGRLISISYGMGHVFLVSPEEVEGVRQGAVTRLPLDFPTGVMRGVFDVQRQSLYVAGLFGWAGNKTRPGGFYRIRPTVRSPQVPVAVHAYRDGLEVEFSEPLEKQRAADPGSYHLTAWNYRWSANYGSPDLRMDGTEGRDTWAIEQVALHPDQRTVFLRVKAFQPAMQYHLEYRLESSTGLPMESFLHGTLHRVSGAARPPWAVGLETAGTVGRTSEFRRDSPGLRLALHPSGATEAAEVRTSRLAALFVKSGEPASAWFPAGPFEAVWNGGIRQALRESVSFRLEGAGNVRLRVRGQEILAGELTARGIVSPRVELSARINPIELRYSAPVEGDAEVRLWWSAPGRPEEPVPSAVLVHEGEDPVLTRFDELREGRAWVARLQCVSCHPGLRGDGSAAMPELATRGPRLEGVGDRLEGAWLKRWVLDPASVRPAARMPRLLQGETGLRDAEDMAAYLVTLRVPASGAAAVVGGDAGEGSRLVTRFGCRACHSLPGEKPEPELLPLDGVTTKFKDGALAGYLASPARHHATTRMPDFQLTPQEAAHLAAHLVALDQASSAARPASMGRGDAVRGRQRVRELGCLQCHEIPGETSAQPSIAIRFDEPAVASRGCLATQDADRRSAPRFSWTPEVRTAVARWIRETGRPPLDRDGRFDFSTRQVADLQCGACHGRDGQSDRWSRRLGSAAPVADEEGVVGSVHVGRPDLSFTGEKLHGRWVEKLLGGELEQASRPAAQGRMPAFAASAAGLARGIAAEHGYGMTAPSERTPDPMQVAVGRQLAQAGAGLGCVTCHGVGAVNALAGPDTATVNFAVVGGRLRDSYYWRFVRDPLRVMPGTMMPRFIGEDGRTPLGSVLDGDGQRQFEALWAYLQSLRGTWPAP